MPKTLKYNYCPFCFPTIQLVKAKRRKHVYQCPNCGFTIMPNWRKGRFESLKTGFSPNPEQWLKETHRKKFYWG